MLCWQMGVLVMMVVFALMLLLLQVLSLGGTNCLIQKLKWERRFQQIKDLHFNEVSILKLLARFEMELSFNLMQGIAVTKFT